MKTTRYIIKGEGHVTLPPLLGTPALSEAGEGDLRVLLALAELGSADAATLAAALKMGEADVAAHLAFWRGAGLVGTATASSTEPPVTKQSTVARKRMDEVREMGAEELADYLKGSDLAALVEAAEQQRGRLFNRSDLAILVALSEELGLDGAYILTLLAFCDTQGDGSPKPLRYAERVAYRLSEHGITTCAALEEYIREQESLRSIEGGLRRMFGIGARKLTAREERAFLTWTNEYGYGEDVIGAAYDVTVNATGKASVAYTDKILSHWHEAGVDSPEAAEALLARERNEKKPKRGTAKAQTRTQESSSFDIGDFFQRAVERSLAKNTADTDGENR